VLDWTPKADERCAKGVQTRRKPPGAHPNPEDGEWSRTFVGTPTRVAAQLSSMATELHLNELIVNTITYSHKARLLSYTLLADAFSSTD
jgi:alkanesulfonate monooxygenase SsuD/methylene tetrahydromethanopterin reductase-like flavin-dependent oxidoreductase (luciferase family)